MTDDRLYQIHKLKSTSIPLNTFHKQIIVSKIDVLFYEKQSSDPTLSDHNQP